MIINRDVFFVKWWKMKWSYKYDKCIKCNSFNFKHKWHWLCTSCWDKKRDKNTKRKNQKLQAWNKYYEKNKNTDKEKERLRLVARNYYNKNREALKYLQRAKTRIKTWKPCLTLNINDKIISLPFEDLEKPQIYKGNEKLFEEFREKENIIDIIREYYDKN